MQSKANECKIVLVTGGNRGLGLEVGRQLGKMGHTILLGCRNRVRGSDAENLLKREGIDAQSLLVDLGNPPTLSAARETVEQHFSRLDVLVNNAAIHYDNWQRATNVNWDIVTEALEVNTLGPWRTAVEFLPLLKHSAHPRIVNVSSESGSLASMSGGTPAYSLSKAGLSAVTRMLASELKPHGVLVNAVCPGWTATDMGGAGGRPVQEGAKGIVWAALLPDDGPTGGFFRDGAALPW